MGCAIENSFETAKNEFGLDHNETRSWHGWHRHVSLVMPAFAMMAAIRHQANRQIPKKTKPPHIKPMSKVNHNSNANALSADKRKRWLVEGGLEIISEAGRRLSSALKARHDNIPWKKAADFCNILRHEYEHVAYEVLWRVAQDDLPLLDSVCRAELTIARAAAGKSDQV